ncbi:AraC family transcriptional regulator [Vibrio hepatarius]|jgi:AraC family transcriptional regulator|uniref:AraC family transcriptional regulator n=1 Tax=Vibrio hepatarius TaxID=171383 RepID=A0A0M0I042_9VIBR|nr:GyrI-like domain-containing protein [Vibrio hepatarius]KOO07263.1 AraC family transcriptional regulator [Vibrio hepatarius]NOI12378.1 AraC family transcriptional regulator [Vibrio hepatarius]
MVREVQIKEVVRYLEQHCSEPLNLEQAAKIANLSPFHFHRVFKALVGETVAEFIRRMRHEKAAQSLMFQDKSVTTVAFEFGFSSSQAMARSFKTYLGVTPSQIKECQTVESYSALMRNSKIGSILRKNRYELPDGLSYSEFKLNQSGKVEMKTENHPQRTIAYVRVVGPYGENYEPAVQKLYLWAGAKGVTGECLFIYHDNPDITPADKCRTDIALVVPDDIEPSNGIEVTTVPAGSYAVLRKTVEEKPQYGQFWNQLIEETVAQGIELDERPCFELYHSYDQQTGRADVSFCEAIKV